MAFQPGYSDRVAHALAFAAKHGALPARRSGAAATQPANVAIILARYGCDETAVVAGVLGVLVNETDPTRLPDLHQRISDKFGAKVAELVDQLREPQFDARGKRRGWKAWKMDFLANLATAEPWVLEALVANQILVCGSMLTDIRRLGVEYLSRYGPEGPDDILWWFSALTDAIERHPAGPRGGMVTELRDLTTRLATAIAAS
jgi:HD domain-containing protein